MLFLILIISLFLFYGVLIIYYWLAWQSVPVFKITGEPENPERISIVIAARNEEKNIPFLLEALEKQTYEKKFFEVMVVDDHSNDATAEIVKKYAAAKLINLTEDPVNSYKKKAIENGIQFSSADLIVTTDADCVPPANWLKSISFFKEKNNSVFIAAPVSFLLEKKNFLSVFQALDFLVLQGITAASVHKNFHSMCNGANLAYEKKIFYEVGGFAGIDEIASGDDMLLMYKIWKRYPGKVHYLKSKEAIVLTKPMQTWKDFFNQRIRWASKATYYQDKRILAVLLLVYIFNLSFLILAIAGFWKHSLWIWLAALWLAKTVIEFPFVYSVAKFFDRSFLMKYFFFFQPVHIAYTIFTGVIGQFKKYEWKGRRVR